MTGTIEQAWRSGRNGHAGWHIAFRYDAAVIDALKARIPAHDRDWDPEATCWWVSHLWEDVLAELLPGFVAFRDQPALF